MPLELNVTYKGAAALFRGSERNIIRLMKEAWRITGQYWVDELLPLRFAPGAVSRYHMKTNRSVMRKRNGKPRRNRDGSIMTYKEWKKRDRRNINPGQDIPLVFTGKLEAQVLSPTNQAVVTLTKGRGVRITLTHEPRGKYVSEYLRKIPAWERKRLDKVWIEAFTMLANRFKGRSKRRYRSRAA